MTGLIAAACIAFVGVVIAGVFVLDVAGAASGMARWHTRNKMHNPRYYRFTDPLSLSTRTSWWRWWGGVFGAIFLVFSGIALFTIH